MFLLSLIAYAKVRETTKGAKLVGDHGYPDLLAVSVYDTKPVHFLSAAAEHITLVEKQQDFLTVSTRKSNQ